MTCQMNFSKKNMIFSGPLTGNTTEKTEKIYKTTITCHKQRNFNVTDTQKKDDHSWPMREIIR